MIKAIIIDDETYARDSLTKVIHQYCKEVSIIGTGENVAEAIELIYRLSPDIVFLDIEMPHGNGFTLFDKIKTPQFETIFTTAYEEYAIKAFRISALDYLTKPTCRLVQLLTYFDQPIEKCGKCDVCIATNQSSNSEFNLREELIKFLSSPKEFDEILENFNINKKIIIEELQALLVDQLIHENDGIFSLIE